jgi:rod shape-determining protein MreC
MSSPGQAAGIPGRGQVSLGARFVLLGLFALALMVVDHKQQHLQRVRDVLSLAVLPMQLVVDMPFRGWDALTESLTDRKTLLRENARLDRELREARFRLQTLEALRRENERLRELEVSLDDMPEQKMLNAEILKVDMDDRQRFFINRGRTDDVYVGQPLLDADGVVGQVTAAFEHQSEAVLITDSSHRIPVTIRSTGLRTIAVGTGDTGMLRLLALTNRNAAEISEGDVLETSGMGGVFPRGRPVAVIESITLQPEKNFAEVEARPLSSLERDQELVLVWHQPPSEDGETGDDAIYLSESKL